MFFRKSGGSMIRRIMVCTLQILAFFLATSILAVLVLRWMPPFTTTVMMECRVSSLLDHHSRQIDYKWVPWDRISQQAAVAVIAAEDQNFPTHHGFDFKSIQKAIDAHDRGRRLRGASTISQQVAKNVFLWSGRSFIRKGLEAYFTVLIELMWPKRRILEVYLNIVELGDGIYGVEAASRRYFNKSATLLTSSESALLAAVLPNPIRFKVDRPSGYVRTRRDWILLQMDQLGGKSYISGF
jgi:monofunctional glycosyltransferase